MRRPPAAAARRRRGRPAARGRRRRARGARSGGEPAPARAPDDRRRPRRGRALRRPTSDRDRGDLDAAIAAGRGCPDPPPRGPEADPRRRRLERATALLGHFHRLGLRSAQLTWNGGNELADGVGVERPGGLTPLGREVVAELERLGIMIDVSHLSEPSFWDLLEVARGPVVATHANAFALCPHRRNLRDDQIRAVADSGGFVGVCFVADVHRRGADARTAPRSRRPSRGARRGRRPSASARTTSSSRST